MEPGRERGPAADRDSLSVRLREVEERGGRERGEPEAGLQVDSHPRRALDGALPERGEQAPARARGGPCANEAPGQGGEHERDADLHPGEQERVVVRARIAGGGDVAADVEPVSEAPSHELGDEGEQAERRAPEPSLVPPRSFHPSSVRQRLDARQQRDAQDG